MIRIGVDAWNLPGDHRGIGRYLRSILREWRTSFADRAEVTLIVPEWHTWTVRRRYRSEVEDAPYRIVSRALHARAGLDVLWFPWNGCSWLSFTAPAVATLHDATNFVLPNYDPQTQIIFRNAVARCRRLITDSVFSQHELARELGIPPERLTPIPLGITPPRDVGPPSIDVRALVPYVLFVGTSEKRKGVESLVRAMEIVQRRHPNVTLVLAGARGDAISGNEAIAMRELGYVDDPTLKELYEHAAVFAFPSRYEGFGLPPLEAIKYGTPVVTTNTSAIPEAVGDNALYVPIDDDAALAAAIERILDDPVFARRLGERGREHALSMTWRRTAEATLHVLEAAACT